MQDLTCARVDAIRDQVRNSAFTEVASRPPVTVFDFLAGHVTWEELEVHRAEA